MPEDKPITFKEEDENYSSVNMEFEPSEIQFTINDVTILHLCANGDIFVKGELVENDKEVVEGLRDFITQYQNQQTHKPITTLDEAGTLAIDWAEKILGLPTDDNLKSYNIAMNSFQEGFETARNKWQSQQTNKPHVLFEGEMQFLKMVISDNTSNDDEAIKIINAINVYLKCVQDHQQKETKPTGLSKDEILSPLISKMGYSLENIQSIHGFANDFLNVCYKAMEKYRNTEETKPVEDKP